MGWDLRVKNQNQNKNSHRGAGDVVKSTRRSSSGAIFDSQRPCGGSQLSLIPVLGWGSNGFFWPPWAPKACGAPTGMQAKHPHIIKENNTSPLIPDSLTSFLLPSASCLLWKMQTPSTSCLLQCLPAMTDSYASETINQN